VPERTLPVLRRSLVVAVASAGLACLALACSRRSPDPPDGADGQAPSASCKRIDPSLIGHRSALRVAARTLDDLRIDGPGRMDRSIVLAAVRRRHEALEGCFNRSVACNPGLNGTLTILVRVDARGRATIAETEGDPALAASGVTECVLRRLRGLDFAAVPPEGGGVEFRLPLTFMESKNR